LALIVQLVWYILKQLFTSVSFLITHGRLPTRGRIIRLELSSAVRRSSRSTEDSSSRRIMRLVSGFIPETNNKCLPRFVQRDNSSSSINMASNPKWFTTNIFTCKNVFRREKQEKGQFAITYAFNSKESCCYKSFSSSK